MLTAGFLDKELVLFCKDKHTEWTGPSASIYRQDNAPPVPHLVARMELVWMEAFEEVQTANIRNPSSDNGGKIKCDLSVNLQKKRPKQTMVFNWSLVLNVALVETGWIFEMQKVAKCCGKELRICRCQESNMKVRSRKWLYWKNLWISCFFAFAFDESRSSLLPLFLPFLSLSLQHASQRRSWNVKQYRENWTFHPRKNWRSSGWSRKSSSRDSV